MKNKFIVPIVIISVIAIVITINTVTSVGAQTPSNAGVTISDNALERILKRVDAVIGVSVDEPTASIGAVVGPDVYDHVTLHQNFTRGGNQVATSSTAATYTLTTDEIREEVSYLSWTVNVDTTLTTMASTSAPLSNLRTGESLEMYFYNASTTAAATATFAAGTGVDLQENEGETVIVNGLEMAKLIFIKKADTDVALWVDVGQVAD